MRRQDRLRAARSSPHAAALRTTYACLPMVVMRLGGEATVSTRGIRSGRADAARADRPAPRHARRRLSILPTASGGRPNLRLRWPGDRAHAVLPRATGTVAEYAEGADAYVSTATTQARSGFASHRANCRRLRVGFKAGSERASSDRHSVRAWAAAAARARGPWSGPSPYARARRSTRPRPQSRPVALISQKRSFLRQTLLDLDCFESRPDRSSP
jgi:hypothetical protein